MGDIARTFTITGFGNMSQLEASLERAGFVYESTSKTMMGAAADAGKAAAKQAQEMGLSADKQVAAAGKAAAASVEASAKITRAQKAAAAAAGKAAEAFGLSADEQVAASDRAMASQAKLEAESAASTSKMGTLFTKLGSTMGAWGVPFSHSVSKMGSDMSAAESKTQKLGTTMASVGKVTLFAGAVGAGAAAVEAVKLGEAFQTAGASIRQATGQSEAEIKKLTSTFAGTAGQFEYSGQQMEAAYGAVAGQLKLTEGHALSAAEALQFETRAAELNAATGGNLAATTGSLAAVMQAFSISVKGSAAASDMLFNVSRGMGAPVDALATAIDKLHSRLGALSPSLKDVATLVLDVGEHGLRGSKGLLVVNTAIQTLVGGSAHSKAALEALGVNIFDSQGKFVGLGNVIAQLAPKLAGLSQQQQIYVTKALFGASASQVMSQIIAQGVPGFDKATEAATKLGTAHEAAKVHSETLGGEMHTLGAAIDTEGGKLGMVLIPDLTKMDHVLAEGIQWMEKHKAAAQDLGYVIGGVLGIAVLVFAERTAAKFVGSVRDMGRDMGNLAGGIKTAVGKIVAQFAVQTGASDAATANIAADSAATDASFAGTATAAEGAAGGVGAAEGTMVGEVEAADAAIGTANVAAGASFKALGLGAVKYLGMIGVAVVTAEIALHGLGSALEAVTGEKQAKSISELIGGENLGEKNESRKSIEARSKSSAQNPKLWLGDAQYNHPLHGNVTPQQFAQSVLGSMGAPMTGSSLKAMEAWMAQEGGNWHNTAKYNPLNTTLSLPGAGNTGSQGNIKAYTSWGQGLEATLKTLQAPAYAEVVKLLQSGSSPSAIEGAINKSPWGTHFSNPATAGTQASGASPHATLTHAQEVAMGVGKETPAEKESKAATKKAATKAAALGIPTGVATMLATAQALLGTKYTSGGGHGSSANDPIEMLKKIGVDCSGFVSRVLASGGLPASGLTTSGLPGVLSKGAGKYVTVADRPEGSQAHTLIDVLGKWFESGGSSKYNPKGGVSMLTAAQAAGELSGGGFQMFHPGGLNAPVKGGKSASEILGGSGANIQQQIANAEAQQNKKHEAEIKKIEEQGKTKLGTYQTDIQGGNVKSLEKLLGYSSKDKTGARSVAGKGEAELVAAVHKEGFIQLAKELVQAHKTALATLNIELKAATEDAQARGLQLTATEVKDQTAITASMAAKVVQAMQDAATSMVDGIKTATTALADAGKSITDSFAAQAQAIKDSTQAMADASNAAVQQIQDKSQVEVDKLGERGLYGLNLVAQKLTVGLDESKTGNDAMIAQAQSAIDTAQTSTDQASAATKAFMDATQAQQDVLVGGAKSNVDLTKQQQNAAVQQAQQNLDNVTASTDRAVQLAQNKVEVAATNSKARQDEAAAELKLAQGAQAAAVAQANAAVSAAQNASSSAVAQAEKTLSEAEAHGGLAEQEAQNALANAEGNAGVVLAQAQQMLTEVQDNAKLSEAERKAEIEKIKAEASTQYAGSGLVVNIEGIAPTDAAAVASEIGWAWRTKLPA
jgi:hypothetical protein